MASLTAHLLETGDHGRLGFHSDCPVCRRERLFGPLSSEPVVSRRAQAVLVGGVLALSSAAPVTAVAQERDQQQEGVGTPPQSGADGTDGVPGLGGGGIRSPDTNGSPVTESPGGTGAPGVPGAPDGPGAPGATEGPGATDSPGFDPGGDTALPYEVAPPAAPEGSPPAVEDGDGGGLDPEDRVLLDSEPVDDPDARLVPPSEPEIEVPSTEPDLGVPPAETPLPPIAPDSPTSSPALPEPETGAEAQEAPDRTGSDPRVEHGPDRASPNEAARGAPRQQTAGPPVDTDAGEVSASSGAFPPLQPTTISDSRPISPDQLTAPAIDPAHRSQGRAHVVQPGESLWSIAKRVLGSEASAAQVAREVSSLWKLNEDRIGTGNPDLLMVGTKLILR